MTGLRVRAELIDLGLLAGWAAVVLAIGFALHQVGLLSVLPPLELNLAGAIAVLLPAVVLLGLTESGRYEASPGKQWCGLRVRRGDGGQLGRTRALLRNLLKIGPPWLFVHAAVLVLMTTRQPIGADVWVLTAAACVVPAIYAITALTGDRRALYDLAVDARVVGTSGARRVAE